MNWWRGIAVIVKLRVGAVSSFAVITQILPYFYFKCCFGQLCPELELNNVAFLLVERRTLA